MFELVLFAFNSVYLWRYLVDGAMLTPHKHQDTRYHGNHSDQCTWHAHWILRLKIEVVMNRHGHPQWLALHIFGRCPTYLVMHFFLFESRCPTYFTLHIFLSTTYLSQCPTYNM